jgi:hypothetical protein
MKQNGFVLPIVFVLIVIMLGIHSQITILIPSLINKSELLAHGIPLADQIKRELLNLTNTDSTNQISCKTVGVNRGKVSHNGTFCIENNDSLKFLKLPVLNKINCTDQSTPLNRQTLTGGQLSEHSFRSPRICLNLPAYQAIDPPEKRVINGNFESSAPTSLSDTVIFSGYVNIPHGISLSRDIGILALGDIQIDTISSTNPLPINLYLHSRSGQIRIGGINGNIAIHCTAKSHNCNGTRGNIYWSPVTTSHRRALYFE